MRVHAILAVFLPMVFCADPDPTTVCLPDAIHFESFDLSTGATQEFAIDFQLNRLGGTVDNITTVHDFTTATAYDTDATGACVSSPIPPAELTFQCLPAGSKYVKSFSIGLGADALQVQTWDVDLHANPGDYFRYAIVRHGDGPYSPLLAQSSVGGAVQTTIYANVTTTVSDPSVFNIPSVCPPSTVV